MNDIALKVTRSTAKDSTSMLNILSHESNTRNKKAGFVARSLSATRMACKIVAESLLYQWIPRTFNIGRIALEAPQPKILC